MTVPEPTPPLRRGLSVRRWTLVAALAIVGLLVVLLGVALLAEPKPCGCSPIRPPTSSPTP